MLKKPPNRVAFKERKEIIDLPNLIETQIKSFWDFLQPDTLVHERKNIGLEKVFRGIFPIKSFDERVILEYISYSIGVSKYTPEECIRRGITYSAPLKVKFRLTDETGIKEEEVYMGAMPLMTSGGTFVINGAERVIVSQLHRSPGIYFEEEKSSKGGMLYYFRIIPYRGSWLEGSFDVNDLIYIYVDKKRRKKKILATTFIRALGYSRDSDIIEEFFNTRKVKLVSGKDFAKLVGKILAEDVIDENLGIVHGKAAEKLTTAMLKRMLDANIDSIRITENADESSHIIRMLGRDPTDSYETALKDFYRKMRSGEPTTLPNARSLIIRLFFDPKRYNLEAVGRYKLNKKLGLKISDEILLKDIVLQKEDIIEAIKYLIRLRVGDESAKIDDIDHLSNRRVRSAGELLENCVRAVFARGEKVIRERLSVFDMTLDTLTPAKIVSAKGLQSAIKDFFGRSQLSQFMDQTNPMAEVTHKRRLSSLGPGGLTRERAGFEVRDVHSSHYGRICPTETPEGPNIGLITSLSTFAKINEHGFIETPYLVVKDGYVSEEVEYMTADQEESCIIAQASSPLDEYRMFQDAVCWVRHKGEPIKVDSSKVTHMDVSPKQLVSVATGLIPFLEHDDANRALMGSNMQRQAVPLLVASSPLVGTGLELRAARDSGTVILAEEDGTVCYVDGFQIVVSSQCDPKQKKAYVLKKFMRSNVGTVVNQQPLVSIGDEISTGDIIADGSSTDCGELSLGKNVLVAFMPWCGYNYEDAIIISERLLKDDEYTSIYIEVFELMARETKLGKEEITRDIPNLSEEMLRNLGDDGIIRIGSYVRPGDILVGKVTPRSETELSPEEKLLRTIFGEKASDVKDASLVVPPGSEGFIMDVKVFHRRDRLSKTDDELVEERSQIQSLQKAFKEEELELQMNLHEKLSALFLETKAPASILNKKLGTVFLQEGEEISQDFLESLEQENLEDFIIPVCEEYDAMKQIFLDYEKDVSRLAAKYSLETEVIRKGDPELESGVICQVKVYVATKRKLQVGDKMAGRHGNKGVVSKIVPECDMPYLEDGTPIDIILNPLGVPSRMNLGQVLETALGYVAYKMNIYTKNPVFESFPVETIFSMMKEMNLSEDGKAFLYDGRTGERMDYRVVVGIIYMLKLSHLVEDKMHTRSIGPYALVPQQPTGGKARGGGQRVGEMEVWALEAYGAANALQEMLTVKSDDVPGRTRIYESIVRGDNLLRAGTPESFNVLVRELQGLCLDVQENIVVENS